MSKMSTAAMELDEQSAELGYDGLQDALNNGYSVVYDETGFHLEKVDAEKEREKAHEAWLKEKQQVLNELNDVIWDGRLDWGEIVRKVEHAIEFINKGEL